MLGIPFLSTYIQRIVKVQSVADSVDWLNYYCTSLLLAFFSLAISAKQYFGSPIQCWVPNEFKSSWEKYAEDYCFIANSYFVPLDQEVPTELAHRHDQISYYRWVPIALAIQALFFWLPNWLWNMLHKQTAINPRAILAEAGKSGALHGAQREKEMEGLAAFLSDTLNIFWKENGRHNLSGLNATLLYLSIKLLYVLNCFGQLIMLNRFLGGKYHSWAWESFLALLHGKEWHESAVFPRQILCDFSVRLLANNHRHTIQCVIMLNLINEKLYLFLHFWLLLVGIVTLINFFYYMLILMLAGLRTEFVKRNINKRQQKHRGFGTRELTYFVQTRLRPDGVLLLHFIRQHIGGRITYELLNELLRLHWLTQTTGGGASTSSTQTDHLTTSNSPNSEKVPEMRRTMNSEAMEELDEEDEGDICVERQIDPLVDGYSRQNTYKPTAYGPEALVYPGAEPIDDHHHRQSHFLATAPHPPFSPSSLLRAISGTASPTTLLMTNGNQYSVLPTLEFIDGQSNEAVKNVEEKEDEEGIKVLCPICHCSFNNSYDLMIHEKTNHAQSAFLRNIDGGDADVVQQEKQVSSSNGTAKLRKSMVFGQCPLMNTTPLTQSRRAKSPLVTGLGTIGKRQGNNVEMPKNNNSNEPFLLKPTKEIEKIRMNNDSTV